MSWAEAKWVRNRIGSRFRISTTDEALYSQKITVTNTETGDTVGTIAFGATGHATFYSDECGTLKFSCTSTEGTLTERIVQVPYYKTYYVKMAAAELYEFRVATSVSDPITRVEYLNETGEYTPAAMDYINGVFDYGSWENAFFIRNLKPVMLYYTGKVAYELDPNDYTKRADGTDSEVADTSFQGNAMMGIPKTYVYTRDGGDGYIYHSVANYKVNDSYTCYAHHDKNGAEIDYTYMPIYNGSVVSGVLRSMSGLTPMNTQTASTEITYAAANNTQGSVTNLWHTEVLADRLLINELLALMGKSTDTQTVFGNGYCSGGSAASSLMVSGTMDKKGLFWGSNTTSEGVKVFGMEHWWGNQWRRIAGWINASGTQKIKLTYGKEDGSTVEGYNTTGSGYITVSSATPSGTSGGYISAMVCAGTFGVIPYKASGSSSTYEGDGLWFSNSQTDYALVGGTSVRWLLVGTFYAYLSGTVSLASWGAGASPSCKPLAA